MHTITANTRELLLRRGKTKERIKKLDESLETLKQGKVPKNMKPFQLPCTSDTFDEKFENDKFDIPPDVEEDLLNAEQIEEYIKE